MDYLEPYIRNHKSLFDEEPATGHFERLQQKIKRKKARINILRFSISIAASIAILFPAAMIWQDTSRQNGMLDCENAADMKICYLNRMNIVASQIEALVSDFDPWDRQELMNEVQSLFDAVNGDFESELPEELPEDRVRAILSDYYRQNMEGLEMIVELIKN